MKIAVPNQVAGHEKRVALAPAAVKKLVARGLEVIVQTGAGKGAHHDDAAYEQAGAMIHRDGDEALWSAADLVVTVSPPATGQAIAMRPRAVLAGVIDPLEQKDLVRALADHEITVFAMEFIPRISRAQSMDVLSSQANIGGYKAALVAAGHSPKMFPLMMTAAGTIAPAKLFVLGAGVAGLQAIATARRLGAVVEAFDIRPAVEEQVKSLGARFVKLALSTEEAETVGGYAKELTPEQRARQTELMEKHIIGADCVIATAAVFGKQPPMLIPAGVVEKMRPGAVIIDLAADVHAGRGNCELTKPGQTYTTDRGVTIEGPLNLPATVAADASHAFANNMVAFLAEITKEGQLHLNLEDEVQKGALIVHEGKIVNELVRSAMESA